MCVCVCLYSCKGFGEELYYQNLIFVYEHETNEAIYSGITDKLASVNLIIIPYFVVCWVCELYMCVYIVFNFPDDEWMLNIPWYSIAC